MGTASTPGSGARPAGSRQVIKLSGRIDAEQTTTFERAVFSALARGDAATIEIDLARVDLLGAPAVAMLMAGHFVARQRGVRLHISHCHGQPLSALQACGVLDLMDERGEATSAEPVVAAVPRRPAVRRRPGTRPAHLLTRAPTRRAAVRGWLSAAMAPARGRLLVVLLRMGVRGTARHLPRPSRHGI